MKKTSSLMLAGLLLGLSYYYAQRTEVPLLDTSPPPTHSAKIPPKKLPLELKGPPDTSIKKKGIEEKSIDWNLESFVTQQATNPQIQRWQQLVSWHTDMMNSSEYVCLAPTGKNLYLNEGDRMEFIFEKDEPTIFVDGGDNEDCEPNLLQDNFEKPYPRNIVLIADQYTRIRNGETPLPGLVEVIENFPLEQQKEILITYDRTVWQDITDELNAWQQTNPTPQEQTMIDYVWRQRKHQGRTANGLPLPLHIDFYDAFE